jgi:hypothetical protein
MLKPMTLRTLVRASAMTLLIASVAACGGGANDNGNASSAAPSAKSGTAPDVASNGSPSATIVGITKISETRVGRSTYDYLFRVNLQNGPFKQFNLSAVLIGAGPGVTIVNNNASFGTVAASAATTSTNTITLRIDRTLPFDLNALVWKIVPETASLALARLETSGMIPVLDRSAALPGPDLNSNGIRDDIDNYLTTLNLPLSMRTAAEQLARALQEAVVVNSADKVLTTPIRDRATKGIACVWDRFPQDPSSGQLSASQMVHSIEKLTANTRARVISYMTYNGSLNGSVSSLPSGDSCEH